MRLVIAALSAVVWLGATTLPAAACSGEDASLKAGMRGATSIFYATIVSEKRSPVGFYDLTLGLGKTVRGDAQSHVTQAIPAEVCSALSVGDSGLVVLASVNPFGVGPNDVYNFFYVIGPGHLSAADAAAILSGAPATDTLMVSRRASSPSADLAVVAILVLGMCAFIFMLLRPPWRGLRKLRSGQ